MAATPENLHSAYRPTASNLLLLPLDEAIDKVVGSTATLITRPEGKTVLVLKAETDAWQMKPGDHVSAFPSDPSSTTTGATAGNGVWTIAAGVEKAMAGPDFLTVKGPNAGSALRYYWL